MHNHTGPGGLELVFIGERSLHSLLIFLDWGCAHTQQVSGLLVGLIFLYSSGTAGDLTCERQERGLELGENVAFHPHSLLQACVAILQGPHAAWVEASHQGPLHPRSL